MIQLLIKKQLNVSRASLARSVLVLFFYFGATLGWTANNSNYQSQGYDVPVESLTVNDQPQVQRRVGSNAVAMPARNVSQQAPKSDGQESLMWELYSQVEVLQQEIQMLRGLLEGQANLINGFERKQKEHYKDLDHRIELLNRTIASGVAKPEPTVGGVPGNTPAVPLEKTPALIPGADEKARYDAAIALVRARKLMDSKAAFSQFLIDFPQSIYTANTHYWLGEVYLALPSVDYDKAREHFETVTTLFPGHSKASACMYKLGVLHHRQGDTEKAKSLFHQVINAFPGSSAAGLAQKDLNKISL